MLRQFMCTHIAFRDSLTPDRRNKSKGKFSDTFALMRNDGKLDNQTLHVLSDVFEICTTLCD
jgi:hypothetical protein